MSLTQTFFPLTHPSVPRARSLHLLITYPDLSLLCPQTLHQGLLSHPYSELGLEFNPRLSILAPGANHDISLSLSFHLCEMGIIGLHVKKIQLE